MNDAADAADTDWNGPLGSVMAYAPGGNLLEWRNKQAARNHPVNEIMTHWLFQQLIFALDYAHQVCHSDNRRDSLIRQCISSCRQQA